MEQAFMPSYVNLADLKRATGVEAGAEAVLREALRLDPGFAPARYALGLTLVRSGRRKEAVAELVRASADAPDDAGFAYASALALNGEGRSAEAVKTLERALERRPLDRNLLMALASIHRDRGETDAALRSTETLLRFWTGRPRRAPAPPEYYLLNILLL